MNIWQRIEQLLSEPTYRTKLLVFLLIGFLIISAAILSRDREPFWSEVLVQFAVVFIAVVGVQLVWDFLGGDLMESRLVHIQTQMINSDRALEQRLNHVMDRFAERFARLEHTMVLFSDLIDGNIGIERIWPDRRSWQSDPNEGLKVWQARLSKAREVDMLGNTLWNNWFHEDRFRKQLFANITQGCKLRLLIYDPSSEVLKIRAKDEKDPFGQMQQEIFSTLAKVAEERDVLNNNAKKNLEVRLTTSSFHLAQIIRADEELLIAIYLSGKSGGPSPTMKVRGPQSTYFTIYREQFEILWARARQVDDAEFQKILKDIAKMGTAPLEP